MRIRLSRERRSSGRVLVEVMVGLMLSSILVAMTGSLWLASSRTFVAMGNYANLDVQSSKAPGLRLRNLRPTPQATGFRDSESTRRLSVTSAVTDTQVACTPKATPPTLVGQKIGRPD